MGMKIKQWLQSLSFRTGVIVLVCYSKGRALGCALRNGKDLPVWRSDHSGR